MGTWLLWRLSMVLGVILAFSLFAALYKFAEKIIHRVKVKQSKSKGV